MFTVDTIRDTLKKLELSEKKYKLMMGGALCIYGIRESTNDIDIGVSGEEFDRLCNVYSKIPETAYGGFLDVPRIVIETPHGEIEVFRYDNERHLIAVNINTFKCQTLQEILSWKTALNREKDRADIAKIQKYFMQ